MVGESDDLALIVLDKLELAARELLEEVRFGFGKHRKGAKQEILAGASRPGEQLLPFTPNRQFHARGKRAAGGDFVKAHTGIQAVGVELDNDGRYQRFGRFGRRLGDSVIINNSVPSPSRRRVQF